MYLERSEVREVVGVRSHRTWWPWQRRGLTLSDMGAIGEFGAED